MAPELWFLNISHKFLLFPLNPKFVNQGKNVDVEIPR